MCQSRLFLLISHWGHEKIFTSVIRLLAKKKWYGKLFSLAERENSKIVITIINMLSRYAVRYFAVIVWMGTQTYSLIFADPVVPLTVLAPTNDAFQKLPKDVMQKIKTNLTFNGSKNDGNVLPKVM